MKNTLALLALAFMGCSDSPRTVAVGSNSLDKQNSETRFRGGDSKPALEAASAPEDWQFDGTELSARVAELIARLDQEGAAELVDNGYELQALSELFQVPGPRGTRLFAYLRRRFAQDAGCFFVFLQDLTTGAVTKEPLRYCSTWSAYTDPELRLVDLDKDGVDEVVTMNFFHNGTVLNLKVDSYWEVDADLSLHRVLEVAREDAGILLDESGFGSLTRTLKAHAGYKPAPTCELEVSWAREDGQQSRVVGTVELQRDDQTRAWTVRSISHDELSEVWFEQLSPMGLRLDEFGSTLPGTQRATGETKKGR